MAQYCLILNGKVIQIESASFNVAPPLNWEIDLTDTVEVGWLHDGTDFTNPEGSPSLPTTDLLILRVPHLYLQLMI
jgi:hypothetical protein